VSMLFSGRFRGTYIVNWPSLNNEIVSLQRKIDCFRMNRKKDHVIKEMGHKCVLVSGTENIEVRI
jgi:hypothetical protein